MTLDLSKKRVIVHNLTLKGIEKFPGVLDFDQRGLLFARPGDVVVTKRPIEPTFKQYLEDLGWDFTGVTFISPQSIVGWTYRSIFYDDNVMHTIKKEHPYYIDTYQNTIEEKKFSERLGLPLYGNPTIGMKYGTKSGFRKLAKKLGLSVPRGFESVATVEGTIERTAELFQNNAEKVVIKLDESISGAGQTHVTKSSFLSLSAIQQHDLVAGAWSKIPQFAKTSVVTVEEWTPGAVASPSIQMEVTPTGEIRILSMKDQILVGTEKWYIGCTYPVASLSPVQEKQFKADATQFACALRDEGFIGFLGLDAIILSDGSIQWVEANVRKPGTFYPRIIAEKLNGGALTGVYYIACDFTVPAFKGASFAKLARALKPYLYPVQRDKHGVIVYNTGALLDAGRFDLVCIGRSVKDARAYFTKVKAFLDSLK